MIKVSEVIAVSKVRKKNPTVRDKKYITIGICIFTHINMVNNRITHFLILT